MERSNPLRPGRVFLTTSWDDGSVFDLKLARVLRRHKIKATFYMPIQNIEGRKTLPAAGIKELAGDFEIGSHTYSHRALCRLPADIARDEIKNGKDALEDMLGREVRAFCFPKGRFDRRSLNLVLDNGFKFARTTGRIRTGRIADKDRKLLHTTLQAYRHGPCSYLASSAKNRDGEGFLNIMSNLPAVGRWEAFSGKLMDARGFDGPVFFHLWGHSWEVEEFGLWGMLEDFFRRIKAKDNVTCCTNTELWRTVNENGRPD